MAETSQSAVVGRTAGLENTSVAGDKGASPPLPPSAEDEIEFRVRERTARLLEINQELEAYTYSISHDLRAPIRYISAYAEMLREEHSAELTEQGREYLEHILQSSRWLEELTGSLLAFSRVNRCSLELQPTCLRETVRYVLREHDLGIRQAGAAVRMEIPIAYVLGMPALLHQAISNLVGNALKYVPKERHPEITISAERRGGCWRLSVVDNGIGIAAQDRERVFRLFDRVRTADVMTGTGIGLPIARRAVERMGGVLDFESKPGEGSRFFLELPATADEPILP